MSTREQDIAELLDIHAQDRQAHFDTDVQAAISFFDDSYLYIRDGEIHHLPPADLAPMYASYFQGAVFKEWDDLDTPVIRISGDGSMAWVSERFRIRATRQENGVNNEQTSVYAGITIFEKIRGKWLRVANASTFKKHD